MNDRNDFEQKAGRLWRDGNETLDGQTASRLNQARQKALATLDKPNRGFNFWLPAAGVAAAMAATWLWLGNPESGLTPIIEVVEVSDMEIMLDDTGLDLLEALEFYAWLETAETDAS